MKLYLIFLLVLSIYSLNVNSQTRGLLTSKYSIEFLERNVLNYDSYRPFPPAGSEKWMIIPAEERKNIISEAEKLLDFDYPVLKASLYLDFVRNGNRSRYQAVYSERRQVISRLLLAEILENQGRFIDDIINGVWAVCEETSWTLPAHIGAQHAGSGLPDEEEPITAILASETPGLLAAVDYFLGEKLDKINPLIRKRIHYEVKHQFLDVMMKRDDFWWMGYGDRFTNNWNPWVVSNYINAILMFEKDQEIRAKSIYRAMDILDNFLNIYPEDGGCDEGPAYWNHAGGRAFNCLELLYQASGGAVTIFDDPLIKNMGDYLWKAYINDSWFVNFADAPASMTPDYFTAFRYGKMVKSKQLMAFGNYFYKKNEGEFPSGNYLMLRILPAYFGYKEIESFAGNMEFEEFIVLPDLEFISARTSSTPDEGFYLAAKGGFNDESHNHNDAGSFIVYLDGEPLLIDAGVGEYTAKTFSSRRYEIWTMQSSYHNLPDINGEQQPYGREYKATNFQPYTRKGISGVSMELSNAYPVGAELKSFNRDIQLNSKRNRVDITDAFEFNKSENTVEFHFMTNHEPILSEGKIFLTDQVTKTKRALIIPGSHDNMSFNKIEINDSRLLRAWPNGLYRISITLSGISDKHESKFRIAKLHKN